MAQDLLLLQVEDQLYLPQHALSLHLPALWRLAASDLVLHPRAIVTMPQLLLDSIAAAVLCGATGCDAVASLLYDAAGPPCGAALPAACQDAGLALGASMDASLADGTDGLDLQL